MHGWQWQLNMLYKCAPHKKLWTQLQVVIYFDHGRLHSGVLEKCSSRFVRSTPCLAPTPLLCSQRQYGTNLLLGLSSPPFQSQHYPVLQLLARIQEVKQPKPQHAEHTADTPYRHQPLMRSPACPAANEKIRLHEEGCELYKPLRERGPLTPRTVRMWRGACNGGTSVQTVSCL